MAHSAHIFELIKYCSATVHPDHNLSRVFSLEQRVPASTRGNKEPPNKIRPNPHEFSRDLAINLVDPKAAVLDFTSKKELAPRYGALLRGVF